MQGQILKENFKITRDKIEKSISEKKQLIGLSVSSLKDIAALVKHNMQAYSTVYPALQNMKIERLGLYYSKEDGLICYVFSIKNILDNTEDYLFFHYDWEEKFDYKSYYLTSNTDNVKNLYLTYAVLNSISEREIDAMGKNLVAEAAKVNLKSCRDSLVERLKPPAIIKQLNIISAPTRELYLCNIIHNDLCNK